MKTGDEKVVKVTFPEDYQAEHLAGKDAEFAVTVKAVKTPQDSKIDDDFAKNLGLESADKLRELVKAQMEQETAGLTRTQMKRQLLDTLAAGHDFPVPERMVEAEFEQIWAQLSQEAQREEDPEAAMKEIESERDDYRRIAERRVRLGLLLSEIGQANEVQISGQEMSMLMQQAAQQYRAEDRERFMQFIQNDPMAAAQLRAPLYEDKVVDFLFEKAEVEEREVSGLRRTRSDPDRGPGGRGAHREGEDEMSLLQGGDFRRLLHVQTLRFGTRSSVPDGSVRGCFSAESGFRRYRRHGYSLCRDRRLDDRLPARRRLLLDSRQRVSARMSGSRRVPERSGGRGTDYGDRPDGSLRHRGGNDASLLPVYRISVTVSYRGTSPVTGLSLMERNFSISCSR